MSRASASSASALRSSEPLPSSARILGTIATPSTVNVSAVSGRFVAFAALIDDSVDNGCGVEVRSIDVDSDEDGEDYDRRRHQWLLRGHQSPVTCLSFTPPSHSHPTLVTVSDDCVIFWDLAEAERHYQRSSQPFAGRLLPEAYSAASVTFNDSGATIALTLTHATIVDERKFYDIIVIDVSTGSEIAVLQAHTSTVSTVMFLPPLSSTSSDTLLLSASHDRTFKLWSLTNYCLLYDSTIVSSSPFVSAVYHPSSMRVMIGNQDGVLWFIEIKQASTASASVDGGLVCKISHVINVNKWNRARELADASRQRTIERQRLEAEQRKIVRAKRDPFNLNVNASVNDSDEMNDDDDDDSDSSMHCPILSLAILNGARYPCVTRQSSLAALDEQKEQITISTATKDSPASSTPSSARSRSQSSMSISVRSASKIPVKSPAKSLSTPPSVATGTASRRPSAVSAAVKCKPPSSSSAPTVAMSSPMAAPLKSDSLLIVTRRSLILLSLNTLAFTHYSSFHSTQPIDDESSVCNIGSVTVANCQCSAESPYVGYCITANPYQRQLTLVEVDSQLTKDVSDSSSSNSVSGELSLYYPSHVPAPATSFLSHHQFQSSTASPPSLKLPSTSKTRSLPVNQPVVRRATKSSGYGVTHAKIKLGEMPRALRRDSSTNKKPSAKSSLPTAASSSVYELYDGLIDAVDEERMKLLISPLHNGGIVSVCYSSDGRRIVSGSLDSTVSVIKSSLTSTTCYFAGHHAAIRAVGLSSHSDDGLLIGSSSMDCSARIWTLSRAEPALVVDSAGSDSKFDSPVTSLSFFYDNRFILLTHRNTLLAYKYEINDRDRVYRTRCAMKYIVKDSHSIVAHSALNVSDSGLVLVSTGNRSLLAVDASTQTAVWSVATPHDRPVHCIKLSTVASQLMLTAATDNAAKLWDLRCGGRQVQTYLGHQCRSVAINASVSPCQRFVSVGSEDGYARVYDLSSGRCVYKLGSGVGIVSDVAYHPLRPRLVTADYEGRLHMYGVN